MSDIGWLYVLANSSMPGLVKVGKTSRSPSERASELSGATGLPTPFIVVYEQAFTDCTTAELFVHTYLDRKGFRVSDAREFFSAPVSDVVRAIILAPGAIHAPIQSTDSAQERGRLDREDLDEIESGLLEIASRAAPWTEVFQEAKDHYYGLGDCLEDHAEALRLFKQAANLGASVAYSFLGRMYERGLGIREDQDQAFKYYKGGAKNGNAYCYWAMGAMLWRSDTSHSRNAEKCFLLFLRKKQDASPDGVYLTSEEMLWIIFDCTALLFRRFADRKPTPLCLDPFFVENASEILKTAKSLKEQHEQRGGSYFDETARAYERIIVYMETILA